MNSLSKDIERLLELNDSPALVFNEVGNLLYSNWEYQQFKSQLDGGLEGELFTQLMGSCQTNDAKGEFIFTHIKKEIKIRCKWLKLEEHSCFCLTFPKNELTMYTSQTLEISNLIKQSNAMLAIFNSSHALIWANLPFTSKFLKIQSDSYNSTMADLFGSEAGLALVQQLDRAIIKKQPILFEWNYPANSTKWYLVNINPSINSEDLVLQAIVIFQDISQRKEIELRLKESEENLRIAQEMAKVGSFEYHVENQNVVWSRELLSILGRSAEYFASLDAFSDLIVSENKKDVLKGFRNTIETGDSFNMNYQILRGDNEVIDVNGIGKRVVKNGSVIVYGTLQDVTEIEKAKRDALQALQKSRTSAKIKQEFLANMSHEIRTPMNSIVGFSKLLRDSHILDKEHSEYAEIISSSAERLLMVLDEVLNVSKLESRDITLEFVNFNLRKLIRTVVNQQAIKAKEKNLDFVVSGINNLPRIVVSDNLRLFQILSNLIDNAIKFTQMGEVALSCELLKKAEDEKLFLKLSVKDSGIGIPKSEHKNILESFTQVDSSVSRPFEGVGLGLSIVNHLVHLLDGQLTLESRINVGSTFTVILPVMVGDESEIVETEENHDKEFLLAGKNVLLVEDNRNNRLLATKILHDLKMNVKEAENGIQALGLIRQFHFDVVLMDVQMPIMDGLEATRLIKKLPDTRSKIPIVALTAHILEDERDRYMAVGMSEILKKPIKKEELAHTLTLLLCEPESPIQKLDEKKPYQLIDLTALKNLANGDNNFLKGMAIAFRSDMPKYVESFNEYLGQGDYKNLAKMAHKMKAPLNIMGVDHFNDILETIEDLGNNKKKMKQYLASQPDLKQELLDGVKLCFEELDSEMKNTLPSQFDRSN